MASQRDRLPFEPKGKRKGKASDAPAANNPAAGPQRVPIAKDKANASLSAIPEEVSKRMVRRMGLMAGIPTGLGIASFFIFYWVLTQGWFELPPAAVLLVTMGLFGLGVVGLSYGILSASWDEGHVGGLIGWEEFKLNSGRLWHSWRAARQEAQGTKE